MAIFSDSRGIFVDDKIKVYENIIWSPVHLLVLEKQERQETFTASGSLARTAIVARSRGAFNNPPGFLCHNLLMINSLTRMLILS